MAEGRRSVRNGVPGKVVVVERYERWVPDDYDKNQHGSKKKR